MNLQLTDDQVLLRDTFAKLFQNESTPARVRNAEPSGFDEKLWEKLVELGVPMMRVPEEHGGAGFGLMDAAILVEEAGRYLAPAPIIETLVAGRLLAESGNPEALDWLSRLGEGSARVTIALHDVAVNQRQLVPGGAVADAVLCREGDKLLLISGGDRQLLSNMGTSPISRWDLAGGKRVVLMQGKAASKLFESGLEEWKLFMAVALAALSNQALKMAAAYSNERKAFGQLIGSYQGLAHPMADSVTEADGAMLLAKQAIWAISQSRPDAAACISMAYWWATQTTARAIARALHLFGGYGLSLEYDIQLYHRKGKSWPLVYGDPAQELERLAQRLWDSGADVGLPPAGTTTLDFSYGAKAEKFAAEARDFFNANLDDELRAHAHHSWEGHHPGFHKKLAEAGLLLPDWPEQYGGQGRNRYEMAAIAEVFNHFGWTRNAIGVLGMVGHVILKFGSDSLKNEVLPQLTGGDAICCLGFSEPSCGSDVFAAQTKAVKEGDDWIINGQKMFTSGADLADYVILLTRTNPDVAKHEGLTMFLVPMDAPGIEVQAVWTLADERTNITYYDNVRVPDAYRLGEVNGGVMVMAQSLSNEQDGSWFALDQRRMVNKAIDWAKTTERDGRLLIKSPSVRERLAKVYTSASVSDVLCRRNLWTIAEGQRDRSSGPMSKLFSSEAYIKDSAELMELMAPDSLLSEADAIHHVEVDYRLSTATSIYAGTSEVMRSLIAENALKMPRTRSK